MSIASAKCASTQANLRNAQPALEKAWQKAYDSPASEALAIQRAQDAVIEAEAAYGDAVALRECEVYR